MSVDIIRAARVVTAQADFRHGNIKALERILAQHALAGEANGLVIDTDHATEALMGFSTKRGDGTADIIRWRG